ncbi:MAG: hypothetical protein AB3N33_05095 [Puniceicoccaceae bacterium]
MEKKHPEQDKALSQFDQWLRQNRIQPRSGLLLRVRERLQATPRDVDSLLDELLQPDTRLRDPDMVRKVRLRMEATNREGGKVAWFNWLAPLAAAATLTIAFVSFQTSAPEGPFPQGEQPPGLTMNVNSAPQLDSSVTQIFALAANLQGGPDMTKLESVEELAFLFD